MESEESKKLIDDCFLRPLAEARSVPLSKIEPPKMPVKAELQVLRMSEVNRHLAMDTLRDVHGPNFKLGDISQYKDKGSKMRKEYWQDRGQLIIQGGCDYSDVGNNEEDQFKKFAITKLESYGFPKVHCVQALDHCQCSANDALALLFEKYYPPQLNLKRVSTTEHSIEELMEMRNDEKLALESIYDKLFQEKEKNEIWLLQFKVDHLLVHSPSYQKRKKEKEAEKQRATEQKVGPKKLICRNFEATGGCKFGPKCRFTHQRPEDENRGNERTIKHYLDSQLDPNWFYLEIRFPKGTNYPYEAPLLFLKTTCPDIPHSLCLRLTHRLVMEARLMAQDGMPSIYTISELLQMQDEISTFLEKDIHRMLDPKKSLFWTDETQNGKDGLNGNAKLPSHYEKGRSKRGEHRININKDQLKRDDRNIAIKFKEKQTNQNYKKMLRSRQDLPAWQMSSIILEKLETTQVLIISGETGCGKSTQVPQFLLDDWLYRVLDNKYDHVEVICTQPRRLSAIGVAERVADERGERIGNTVGYQIRLENKISTSTRLTFCTTGILLRRLQSDPQLENVSHVIVDEVHERSEESDFLLLILKQLLLKRPELKVILMSATLNANLFGDYFDGAPVLEIPGRTFPVEQLFLEDILDCSRFVLEPDSQFCRKLRKNEENELAQELEYSDVKGSNAQPPLKMSDDRLTLAEMYGRYPSYSRATTKSLFLMDHLRINPELIEWILKYIVEGDHGWPQEGAILVFLPGLAEIQAVHDALTDSTIFNARTNKYLIVPLHSTLTNEEQGLVFKKPANGQRKIVLSTNIAETSVTIDDCVFVIDCGQMKEKRFDPNKNMESLELTWVSRANANQRKGRAGRVMPGVAIHLFTHHRFTYQLLAQPVPEIQRVPLEQLLLRIKTLPNFKGLQVDDVISNLLEAPTVESVVSAIKRLQDVGAFDMEECLTPLGHHLSELPVDVRIGKLMLYGAIFQCVDSVLTVAACLSYKSPFVSPFSKRQFADAKKKSFSTSCSDQLTVLTAYKKWIEVQKKSKYGAKCYADENYLSWRTLETLMEIKHQFLELLISIGFIPASASNPNKRRLVQDNIAELTGVDMNVNGENNQILAALLCAALFPNIVKVMTPEKMFTQSAGGAVPRLPNANELRFKTRDDGYVAIHPSSINSETRQFTSPFLVYQEKVKTSRIFIRECTMVPLLPVVLFSGSDMTIELHGGEFIILLDNGWLMVQADTHEVAELIKCLRKELGDLLEEKIKDPCLNLMNHDKGKKIISTIVQLITKER